MLFPRTLALCALLSLGLLTAPGRSADFTAGRVVVVQEEPVLAEVFARAGVTGTFVMLDPVTGALRGHDATRAFRPYIPASTFKIANALIGLDCGSVASVDEILPYGGQPQPIKEWEHDMSLRDGIKISNVPVFQELARRTGLERMKAGLAKLHYGNADAGTVVDQFWLRGPLQISAVEQVDFLRRLAAGELPVTPAALTAVQEITLQPLPPKETPTTGTSANATTPTYRLHAKTGWGTATTPAIGWYVGWVEQAGHNYPFALNIDMPDQSLAPKRISVAKECLSLLGVGQSR